MEDYKLIEIAKQELSKNQNDENLWKKCLTLMQNNKAKAEDKYIRQRVIQLKKLSDIQISSLEEKLISKQKGQDRKVTPKPEPTPKAKQKENTKKSKTNVNSKEEKPKGNSDTMIALIVIAVIIAIGYFIISSSQNNDPSPFLDRNNTSANTNDNTNDDTEMYKYGLVILTSPDDAKIKILNSNVEYFDGVRLKEGKYQIEVSAKDYETARRWVNLKGYLEEEFYLKKKNIYLGTKPSRNQSNLKFDSLYYCLVEQEILDYMTKKIKDYSQDSVNKYDGYVNNYRTYCANKKYYNSDFNKAEREKKKNLSAIHEEALNRFSNDLYLKKVVDFKEKKPAPYKKILTKNELLYCQSELIRLNTVQNKLQSKHYLKYDKLADDYNSRCKAKHYLVDMKHVEKIIKRNKTKIENQGLKRFGMRTKTVRHSLTIMTNPPGAKVMILNIKPAYKAAMKLREGKYHIKIKKHGYKIENYWINLNKNKIIVKNLEKLTNQNKIEKKEVVQSIPPKKNDNYSLSIKTNPSNAKIMILNIDPKYRDGIKLKKGKYHIKIRKEGYKVEDFWINLEKDEYFTKELKKISNNITNNSGKPSMSHLPSSEKKAIERACDATKKYSGPASYYKCIQREISSLRSIPKKPSMSHLPSSEKKAIERACDATKKYSGPASYYKCIQREISRLN